MTRTRAEFGWWRNFRELKIKQIFNLSNGFATIAGVSAGILAKFFLSAGDRLAVSDDMKALAGALIGIVFSSFALIIGLMSDRYAVWLSQTSGGIQAFLRPFLVSVGIQVGTLFTILLYKGLSAHIPVGLEQVLFGTLVAFFLIALLDIVALAKTAYAHGVTRADIAQLEEQEKDGKDRRKTE